MRYEIRWSNGFWRLFDTEQYRPVAMFGLRKEAEEALRKVSNGVR